MIANAMSDQTADAPDDLSRCTVAELSAIAFSSITDVVSVKNGVVTVKDLAGLTTAQRAAIAEVYQGKDGSVRVRMHDKAAALDELLKRCPVDDGDDEG